MKKTKKLPNPVIHRIHLEEEQQDLTHVDVFLFDNHLGTIIDVSVFASDNVHAFYYGKAFDLKHNQPGVNLNFAEPSEEFKVVTTRWTVDRVEVVELEKLPLEDCKLNTRCYYFEIIGSSTPLPTYITHEPWDLCGTPVVKVNGKSGGVAASHLFRERPKPQTNE